MRILLPACGLALVLLGVSRAEDVSFKKSKLTAAGDLKETPVDLIVSDVGVAVRSKAGTSLGLELPYSAIRKLSYAFIDKRRLTLVPLFGASALFLKGQSHWLVIESGAGAVPRSTVLRLDKTEYRGVIAALNTRSGKRVEVLDPTSTLVDPTVGSHDEDETVPFQIDRVLAALKPSMESVGCKVGRSTSDHIECHRSQHLRGSTGPGAELVTVYLEAHGQDTRVRIKTIRGLGRDWSSPIYREMRRRPQLPGA